MIFAREHITQVLDAERTAPWSDAQRHTAATACSNAHCASQTKSHSGIFSSYYYRYL